MLKVVIVDDQPLYRRILSKIVDWESLGMVIVADVHNGQEAIYVIEAQSVDIVITDMKMPVLGGLGLIQWIHDNKPEIQCIALSAYDEFKLVRNSYKLGVREYLLKSELSEKEVRNVLLKMAAEVDGIRAEQSRQQRVVDYLKENRHLLKGKLFKELIWGDGDKLPELQQKLAELEIKMQPACFMLMVLSVKGHRSLSTEFLKEKYEILGLEITGKIQMILDSHGAGEVFYNTTGEYVIILSQSGTNSEYAFVQGAFMLFDKIEKDMRDELGVSIIGGLSTTGHGLESLRELYGQASSAASCHFIRGTGRLVAYNDINWRGVLKSEFVNQKLEQMKGLLKGLDFSSIRDGAALLKINSENIGNGDIGTIRELFDKYYYYLNDYAETHNILKEVQPQLKQYASELRQNGTLNELNNWIASLVTKIGESFFCSSQLIKHAKNYIAQHFSEDISLCSVAEALGVSSSYLSRIFIKDGEGGFSDYLAKVRIKAAIEYIQNSNMKIYEIAEAVGYPNPENFTRMFRKRVGRSPKQFFK